MKPLIINTVNELALQLSISLDRLILLAEKAPYLYNPYTKVSNSGRRRLISPPQEVLKKAQRSILKKLLYRIPLPETFHGSIPGHSVMKFVTPHLKKPCVCKIDIAQFFPSVHSTRVYKLFIRLGCAPDVARLLTLLTTFKHQLPQGSPTSPYIAALVLDVLDSRFRQLCSNHNIKYGFYVDDIVFSGSSRVSSLKNLFCNIVHECGYNVRKDKVKIMHSWERQDVAGVVINTIPNLPIEKRRNLRLELRLLEKRVKAGDHGKSVERNFRRLEGQLSYLASLNPKAAHRLIPVLQEMKTLHHNQ